jgi:hypothetical protein
VHDETLSVAMRVNNPDPSPLSINSWQPAQAPTGFIKSVGDDFPITSRPEGAVLGLDLAQAGSA